MLRTAVLIILALFTHQLWKNAATEEAAVPTTDPTDIAGI